MHRENQIKQFPIVTTHWCLRHETSGLCEKTNSIYIVFYLLYTTMSKWSECAHTSGVWRVCARALAHAWRRACLKRGADATSWYFLVGRRALSSPVSFLNCLLYDNDDERSMYPFHSSVTSQTHMPQLHPPHPASLPPNHVKNNRSRNSLLRHDTGDEKKKRNLTMTKD